MIVNFNAGELLAATLEALSRSKSETVALGSVTVVDNASTDQSLLGIDKFALPLTVIRNPGNRGFAAASNQGARVGTGDLLLFLNPDTRITPDCLAIMSERLRTDQSIGVVGAALLDDDGTVQRSSTRFPRPGDFLAMAFALHRLPSRFNIALSEADHRRAGPVDHVMGACYLIPRKLFDELGGFDERFFVYLEDLDLSLRVKQAGYRVWFETGAICYHESGGTSRKVPLQRLLYSLASRVEYARKHFTGPWPAIVRTSLLAEPLVRGAWAIARGDQERLRVACGLARALWSGRRSRTAQ